MSKQGDRLVLLTIVGLIGMALIWCNCDSSPVGDWASTVTGNVTDSISGQPLDSAQVYYDASYAIDTDSTGKYSLTKWGDAQPTITCSKAGYVTKTIEIDVVRLKTLYEHVDFQLAPVPETTE